MPTSAEAANAPRLPDPPRHPPEPDNLNAWLAPGFSPLGFYRRMLAVLRGAGGHVEQSFLYFDHASAADWAAIAAHPEYVDAHQIMPLDRAAAQVHRLAGPRGADVIALGPGDGRIETRFVSHLATLMDHPAIRLYLLDVSQPLLAEAYRHASLVLGHHDGITPVAILGSFHDLPQYGQLSYVHPATPRRKVVIMLGGTFGNLDHECRFVRDSLCGFPPGTLLLIDYPCCFAPADKPDEIRARDPWLAEGKGAVAWRERVCGFWASPLRRYVPNCADVVVRTELAHPTGSAPGTYVIEARARVVLRDEPDREFSVFRLGRHDPAGLARGLREVGWDAIDGWPYGHEVGYPRALSLYQKR